MYVYFAEENLPNWPALPQIAQVRMVNSMLLQRVCVQEMIFEASDEPGGGLQLDYRLSPRNIYLCHPRKAGRGQQKLKNIVAPDVTDRLRRNDAAADPSTPIEH